VKLQITDLDKGKENGMVLWIWKNTFEASNYGSEMCLWQQISYSIQYLRLFHP